MRAGSVRIMAFPVPITTEPMEATSVAEIPTRAEWQYEPKWDGFRCLVFRDGDAVELHSKSGQPLGRYVPEIVAAIGALKPKQFALDGELMTRFTIGAEFEVTGFNASGCRSGT